MQPTASLLLSMPPSISHPLYHSAVCVLIPSLSCLPLRKCFFLRTDEMLATLMTVLFLVVRTVEQLTAGLFHEELQPYLVYQPLPWQVQCVSHNRRGSRLDEKDGSSRHRSTGGVRRICSSVSGELPRPSHTVASPEKAAVMIQTQYRKYQQRKQKDPKNA
ncbi:uncharacterized protein LOC121304072 [Polyodon spathula]|uniref:uncharacterized protein LOC121304072 n=1 Tax=Polyodon spathula TaxID=7913 RepID=UPI001B7E1189|nr:uncharacterized protein LOC121304072 [Polyodon spathula]